MLTDLVLASEPVKHGYVTRIYGVGHGTQPDLNESVIAIHQIPKQEFSSPRCPWCTLQTISQFTISFKEHSTDCLSHVYISVVKGVSRHGNRRERIRSGEGLPLETVETSCRYQVSLRRPNFLINSVSKTKYSLHIIVPTFMFFLCPVNF